MALPKPMMRAEHKTIQSGCISFSSFGDTGMMDNIHIWSPSMEEKQSEFFSKVK